MTSLGFSDQYIVLDSYRAAIDSDLANGELTFNLAIQGFTTETTLGVTERLNRICEIEVEEFQFPADIPYIQTAPRFAVDPSFTRLNISGFSEPYTYQTDGTQYRVFDAYNSELNGYNSFPLESNVFNEKLSKLTRLFDDLNIATLPTTRTITSTVLISPISDVVTMYIKETGLQSISDMNGSRHNFNFKVSTIENTTVYNIQKRKVDEGTVDGGHTADNSYVYRFILDVSVDVLGVGDEIEASDTVRFLLKTEAATTTVKSYSLKPTKNIYVFTDPIIDINKLTLVFKNPDNPIAMYPSVYYNVPAVFMTNENIDGLVFGQYSNTFGLTYAYLCFIINNHGLVNGDVIIVNDVTMVVYGSYDMVKTPLTIYPNQAKENIIIAEPLMYKLSRSFDTPIDKFVTIKIPKRRIRVPLRLRRVVDRRTNSIISTS
jgi:hypothetical protein